MKTFLQFEQGLNSIPLYTSYLLSDLGEAKGMQELYTRQSPQTLKTLKDFAIIESSISSNRIEGVDVDKNRVATVVFGKSKIQDRNEEEVRGYKNALTKIFAAPHKLNIDEKIILFLHKTIRGEIGDAGRYKEKDGDIIEIFPNGRSRVRFKPVSAPDTSTYMNVLIEKYHQFLLNKEVHPLISIAAFNLDFLCIHPFRDGNGRISRLLLLLQLLQTGYEAGRYISLERLIESNKERYYETLEKSSQKWHEGKHEPWHYINFLLYIFKSAYNEFAERASQIKIIRGTKSELIKNAIKNKEGFFTISELQSACPGISIDMIRKVLKDMQKSGKIKCIKPGRAAAWEKTEKFGN